MDDVKRMNECVDVSVTSPLYQFTVAFSPTEGRGSVLPNVADEADSGLSPDLLRYLFFSLTG